MSSAQRLADVLAEYMRRPEYPYTPGLLHRRSGVPKAMIVNWLEGRVEKPRHWQDLVKVAAALRLSTAESSRLLQAGGHPAITRLHEVIDDPKDRALLTLWADSNRAARPTSSPAHFYNYNLPVPSSPLIGREREAAAARSLLQRAEIHLLTLVGPGASERLALRYRSPLSCSPISPTACALSR